MSLHMAPGMARLTVLGHGWNDDASIISGDGFTFDGDLWKDIADGLDYEIPDGMEWDSIADSEFDLDHTKIIYTDLDDNSWTDPFTGDIYPGGGTAVYTDFDGNEYFDLDNIGVWTNPDTGEIYDGNGTLNYTLPDDLGNITGIYTNPLNNDTWSDPTTGMDFDGIGSMWVPESMLANMSDSLSDIATSDSSLARYSIPDDVIPSLYGGKVSIESEIVYPGTERPHNYTPPVWYIQTSSTNAELFLGEPFYHGTATGGSITVYDEAVTIRDGSTKEVYYSGCSTRFTSSILPSPYSGYPIQYVCWQCLYGSLSNYLLTKTDDTITTDDIENGTTGKDTMTINGERYYRMKAEQVKDRI